MDNYAILQDGQVVPVEDVLIWARWFDNDDNRRVAETYIRTTRISTTFIGLNHAFVPDAPPLWFETMVFDPEGRELNGEIERYGTLEEARLGHERMVAKVQAAQPGDWRG